MEGLLSTEPTPSSLNNVGKREFFLPTKLFAGQEYFKSELKGMGDFVIPWPHGMAVNKINLPLIILNLIENNLNIFLSLW